MRARTESRRIFLVSFEIKYARVDLSGSKRELERYLDKLYRNDIVRDHLSRTRPPFPELTTSPVYCFGANSTDEFKTAQVSSYSRLFEYKPIEEVSLITLPMRSGRLHLVLVNNLVQPQFRSPSQISHIPLHPPYNDEIEIDNDFQLNIAPSTCVDFGESQECLHRTGLSKSKSLSENTA
jgi:hypothetical protein